MNYIDGAKERAKKVGIVLLDYWFLTLIAFYLAIILSFPTPNYKYSVTAPGFALRGVDTFIEDKENQVLEFDKNDRHYKFVGTYEIRTNKVN